MHSGNLPEDIFWKGVLEKQTDKSFKLNMIKTLLNLFVTLMLDLLRVHVLFYSKQGLTSE